MVRHPHIDVFCHPDDAQALATILELELEAISTRLAHLAAHRPDCGLTDDQLAQAQDFDFHGRHTAGVADGGAEYAPAVFACYAGRWASVPALDDENYEPLTVQPADSHRIPLYKQLRNAAVSVRLSRPPAR